MFDNNVLKNGHSRSWLSGPQCRQLDVRRSRFSPPFYKPYHPRQHEPALGPAEDPGNGAEILDLSRFLARRGATADVQRGNLADHRGCPKVLPRSLGSRTRSHDEASYAAADSASIAVDILHAERFGSAAAAWLPTSRQPKFSRFRRPTSAFEYLLNDFSLLSDEYAPAPRRRAVPEWRRSSARRRARPTRPGRGRGEA